MTHHPIRSRRKAVEFTTKEAALLWHAIGDGADNDAIDCIGLTEREKVKLGAAANRLADTFKLGGSRF